MKNPVAHTTLKIDAEGSSETSVLTYEVTRCHVLVFSFRNLECETIQTFGLAALNAAACNGQCWNLNRSIYCTAVTGSQFPSTGL
jgi:hypothetical protein